MNKNHLQTQYSDSIQYSDNFYASYFFTLFQRAKRHAKVAVCSLDTTDVKDEADYL